MEKFEFENPTIMEDKQCKQTHHFSLIAKGSDYFLSLDDESKQKYKVKTSNIQGMIFIRWKRNNIHAILVSFHQCNDIVYYS